MANYYNPYTIPNYPANNYYIPSTHQQFMLYVDGEGSAKAWQPSGTPAPNTIIPLFDVDGQHVYFKSFDAYGRMNPLRKGRIVFEEEVQQSEAAAPISLPDMSQYVTKNDLDALKDEIQQLRKSFQQPNGNNQNRSNNRG